MESILKQAKIKIDKADNLANLAKIRVEFLGKKGQLTQLLHQLGQLDKNQRPQQGAKINQAKDKLNTWIDKKESQLEQQVLNQRLATDKIDISFPARGGKIGHIHPISSTLVDINNIFIRQGFEIATGPEIEDDFHNFSALNIPQHHPARAMHDTFYFNKKINNKNAVLRTHTSPVQIRAMLTKKPPLQIIAPGRVYRCDADITHTPMFHQVEGLIVDKEVNFAQLKGLLTDFLRTFFAKKDLQVRFRPSYFPFTEPSAEVDIACVMCAGSGCRVCKKSGFLEILGCGVVHPNVFRAVNLAQEKYRGLAFGIGVERLAMLRYGISDLRLFFENHYRFLNQF